MKTLLACLLAGLSACDLLFSSPREGNAITQVTSVGDETGMDHVAVVIGDGTMVIEAVPEHGVRVIGLDSFLRLHSSDAIFPGRVQAEIDTALTLNNLMQCVGLPYDSLYLADNDAVYCSELVTDCFVDRSGRRVFEHVPMTFRDAEGNIPDYWTALYARHGMAVPEGKAGSNPTELWRRVTRR